MKKKIKLKNNVVQIYYKRGNRIQNLITKRNIENLNIKMD